MKKFFIVINLILFSTNALAQTPYLSCTEDPAKLKLRSEELQKIVAADQADRTDEVLGPEVPFRDRQRRMRVGEIFGEGCFSTAKDFSAAALVYQHGDHTEQYWQAFSWFKKSYELGEESQKRMMALAIDRYLASAGKKQLFATQAQTEGKCWCLPAVESSFTDARRMTYTGKTLRDAIDWVHGLNKEPECRKITYCAKKLEPTPQGTIIGFW